MGEDKSSALNMDNKLETAFKSHYVHLIYSIYQLNVMIFVIGGKVMISRLKAHLIIHGFAVAHGGTAFALSQVPFADTAALTAETIAMVSLIVKECGASWGKATIEAFAAQQLARYVGVEAAKHGYKYIPLYGNTANAATSFAITEAVGWATYEACKAQAENS